ncbi:hypothetical protein [Flavobacterium phycosphaerae]|uniref:hypothetical protein n=1 Tax=Flavobacterium phycosphaerae TaxID=2697515 RepID=UPI00138AB62F|nr:hypothetical protein [Flavobacterium phycosphaerae]
MKKKLNVVLLVLMLSLWGTVIYRYVNQYFVKKEPLSFATITNSNYDAKNKILKKDTFELNKIIRDPFLCSSKGVAKRTRINSNNVSSKKELKKELSKATSKTLFPNVRYFGYIKSVDNKAQETILLSSDGKFLKLHLNQDKDGLKVTALNKDSIKVYYNKESKWFRVKKK